MELQTKHPPELEFSMPEVEESLTAYLSAIGGAVIGLLLTLLILAIWNGGTLNFTNTSKVNALQAGLTGVATDLEAVDANVDALGQRLIVLEQEAGAVAALQKSLTALDGSLADLDQSLSDHGIHINELDAAVTDLQTTRRNFDLFTAALSQALAQMESGSSSPSARQPAHAAADAARPHDDQTAGSGLLPASSAESTAPPPQEAQPAPDLAEPVTVVSREVAPDALLVYLFVDVDADGAFDDDENLIAGAAVTLIAPDGAEVTTTTPVDSAGALFGALTAGGYTVAVENPRGYALASQNSATVNVDPEAEAGNVVYFAVVTSAAD